MTAIRLKKVSMIYAGFTSQSAKAFLIFFPSLDASTLVYIKVRLSFRMTVLLFICTIFPYNISIMLWTDGPMERRMD